MTSKMDISLQFKKEIIEVECRIDLGTNVNQFQFILNKQLNIKSIQCNEHMVEWTTLKTYYPTFRVESKQIELREEDEFNALIVKYEGPINGWCNFIKEHAKALSYYSVWYPQELSEPVEDVWVNINQLSDHTVLKADYDKMTERWVYGGNGYDICNILAFKNGYYFLEQCGDLAIYYLNSEETKVVEYIKYYYEDVMEYYINDLFKTGSLNQLDIVSLGIKEDGQGGYFRKELVVFTDFLVECPTDHEIELYFASLISHELAHHWCTGANEDSWEDWLNETTAECSSLLYALKRNNLELFNYIIEPKLDRHLELPEIKTADESRPNGVHDKGTVLFYFIYKKYGVETLKNLVSIFNDLEKKTTKSYLNLIESKLGSQTANLIESNLGNRTFEILL